MGSDGEAAPVRFRAVLEQSGKTATGVQVPEDAVARLGSGRRPAVRVTIGGHSYRSTVAVMGGRYMLGVSAENRALAGVAAGDTIDVELRLDAQPREVTVPADLAAALDEDDAARRRFDQLSYSNRQRYVLAVEAAKRPETRQRRIAETVRALRDG